jgi:hypothetical protein
LPPILRCSSQIGRWQCAAGPPDVVSLTSARPGTGQAPDELQQILDGKRFG